jgi:hypothetical protein
MADSNIVDQGGLILVCKEVRTGADNPGDSPTSSVAATTDTAQTISAAKTFSVMPLIPTATVAATGTVQADAAAVTTGFTLVSAADAAKGVKLPAAVAGSVVILKNGAAAILKVWPNTDDAVNAIAANSNYVLAANTSVILVAYDATTWYSIPLLAS